MRVTIVNDYIDPIGGVEIFNEILSSLLKSQGHTVQLIGGTPPTNEHYQFLQSIFSLKYKREIGSEINSFSPDVVIAHSIYYNISPSFLLNIRENTPVIHLLPNLSVLSYSEKDNIPLPHLFLSHFRTIIHRYCLRHWVDLYIAPSETAKKHLELEIGFANVVRIPFPAYWDIADEPFVDDSGNIIYVGRLAEEKGVDVLIRSLSSVSAEVSLDIIGEGPMESMLRELVSNLNLEDQIQFYGYMSHEKLRNKYRNATATIVPSTIEENFGLVILESLSQGTPVITTDIGGQQELIEGEKCGLVVSPNDEVELSSAIDRLVNDEALREDFSWNAIKHSKKFSKEKYIEDMEAVLEKVIIEN